MHHQRMERDMIVVLGSVLVQEGKVPEAVAASHEHVERSRAEPGCIEHGVSIDAENPNRLVFVERWASIGALKAHFAVPGSRAFVKAVTALASSPPSMAIYEATEVTLSAKGEA